MATTDIVAVNLRPSGRGSRHATTTSSSPPSTTASLRVSAAAPTSRPRTAARPNDGRSTSRYAASRVNAISGRVQRLAPYRRRRAPPAAGRAPRSSPRSAPRARRPRAAPAARRRATSAAPMRHETTRWATSVFHPSSDGIASSSGYSGGLSAVGDVPGRDDQRLHVAVAARELVGEDVELEAVAPDRHVVHHHEHVDEPHREPEADDEAQPLHRRWSRRSGRSKRSQSTTIDISNACRKRGFPYPIALESVTSRAGASRIAAAAAVAPPEQHSAPDRQRHQQEVGDHPRALRPLGAPLGQVELAARLPQVPRPQHAHRHDGGQAAGVVAGVVDPLAPPCRRLLALVERLALGDAVEPPASRGRGRGRSGRSWRPRAPCCRCGRSG